ncbi:MAG: chitobiase/beta-hexosaminidase C-terminal domain-containing protein [Prevotella sp.]|nr:chitobiase/beta-hexosaminidase C-terminal domain-containing protein [Prevotella sp.]
MTKRLFSLLAIMLFAMAAWADDLATFSSQTIWTAESYSGSDFGKDSRGKETTGTFDGTTIGWNTSQVLTCSANAVLSFGYSGSGKLHVVYGATSQKDGTFYVKVKKNGESVFTNAKELAMEGVAYSGILGTRSGGDYKYTLAETAVDLTDSGTINIGADQGYCIYAILYDPLMTVDSETTWTFENFTASTSITATDKLYQRATAARNFTFVDESGSGSFSDGKNVSWTKVARSTTAAYLGTGSAIPATTTASNSTGDATPFMAFDAAVPGTCYALVKSSNNGNIRIYFTDGEATSGGTGKANTNSAELTEIQLTATTTGTFFIGGVSSNQRDIYAIRFVPSTVYAITVQSASNGSVSADLTNAPKDATVTLTVTPANNYQLKTLSVKTANGDDIAITQNATDKNVYTFTMPAGAVTVTSTFAYVTPVTVTKGTNERTLSNGLIDVTINDNGKVTYIYDKVHNKVVMSATDDSQLGYFNFNYRTSSSGSVSDSGLETTNSASITENWSNGGDMVEILYPLDDTKSGSKQTWKIGYVMRSGVSGLYAYAILEGSSGYSELHEARIGWRVNPDMNIAWVSDGITGTMPTPAMMKSPVEQVQDATFKLSDGSIYTKYDWANFVKDDQLHGIMGNGYGAWLISPSTEWVNGGPMKQELTVHATETTPIILQTLHSSHFGAQPGIYNGSETKLFGPCLFYVNSGTDETAMIADAKQKAAEEVAAWPYNWFNNSLLEKSRSTVTGKIQLSSDFTKTTKIQVILAKEGKAPLLQGNGYQFYGETDASGNFSIEKVRPGNYTLYAYALNGDASGMLEKTGISVSAGATNLGTIDWSPKKYGRTLWRIGEADHTTSGFSLSDSKRQYGLWNSIPSGNKTYTVGSSSESEFYYAQVTNNETWSIKWNSDKAYDTPLYLTIALAGASNGAKIEVKVNNNNAIQSIGTTNDNALVRSAVLAGADALYVVEIPAGQVVKGENTINLKTWDISSPGGVMYDLIKLESTEGSFIDYGNFKFTGQNGGSSGTAPIWSEDVTSNDTELQMIAGDEFGQRFACGPKNRNNSGSGFKFRSSGSYDGLWSQYDSRNISILKLNKGDMVTLTLIPDNNGNTNLTFANPAQAGLTGTDVAVENGTTYTYNGEDGGNLDFKTIGQVYIQSVIIQKPATYAAPTYTVSGNKITVTPPSPKGTETLKTFYKVNYANAQPEIDNTWSELPSTKIIEIEHSAYVFIYSVNADKVDDMSEVAKADVLLPVYGTYDFSQMAVDMHSVVDVTAGKAATFVNGEMQVADYTTLGLNRAFSGGSNITLRWASNADKGLQITANTSMGINRLTKGDWIKITYKGDPITFTSNNLQPYGTTTTATEATSDAVYVITDGEGISMNLPKNAWVYSIQIANTGMAPTVSYKENKDGKAVYTITSLDGNKIQYRIGSGEIVSSNATTVDVSVSEKCTLTTWAVSNNGNGAETVVELLTTPMIENNGTYNFSENLLLDGNLTLSLEDEVALTVDEINYYKPDFTQAATFANQFVFERATDMSKILLRNKQLYIGKDAGSYSMVILNAPKGYKLSVTDGNKKVSKLYIDGQEWEYDKFFDIAETKNIVLKFDVTGGNASIQKIAVASPIGNVTITRSEEKSTNASAIYVVSDFHSGQTLYYHRPQDDEGKFNSAVWKSDYDTTPMQITCTKNGELIYYVVENGIQSKQTIITVNSLITRPNATIKSLDNTKSVYTLTFQEGNTLYYTIPGGTEKNVNTGSSVDVDITTPGRLVAYAKMGELTSDTLKTTVYVKTPAIAENGVYDFAKIADVIGGDYTLNTRPSGETVTIGGITLTKPDDIVANTLDRFAFASKRIDASNGRLYETDWRLLNAGRLRSSGTVADTLAILNAKKGDYLLMTFSGKLNYMSQSTAKLAEGTDELTSKQAYEVLSDGDILIVNKSGTTSDITLLTITDTEVVSSPYFTERDAENEVVLNVGESSLGKKTYTYYTLDGKEPTTRSNTISEKTTIKVENSCTVKAISISETGVKSGIASYTFNLTMASTSAKKMYDLAALVNNGDTLKFDISSVKVSVMENNAGWEEKSRGDFVPVSTFNNKISIRVGYKSVDYVQVDSVTMALQLKRAMAVHDLAVGDKIVIMYEGGGSLINVTPTGADSFTAGGKKIAIGEEVPSGAEIVVTNASYSQNYLVFNVTGTVYITAIYINSDAPEVVIRPQVEQTSVSTNSATYHITWEKGAFLYYTLSTDNDSIIYEGGTSGELDIVVEKSAKLTVWAERDGIVSQELTASVFAPTPAPSTKSEYDFAEAAQDLPADIEVELDPKQEVKVNNIKLYKPTAMTAKTFNGKFAFEETNTSGKIKIRQNRNLLFSRGGDMRMAVLDLSRGDIVAFDFSGTIQINNSDMLEEIRTGNNRTRAAASVSEMESGTAYRVTESGDLLLTMKLSDLAVNIAKMYVGEGSDRSEPMAIDFATAAEEEDSVVFGNSAAVWYGDRTQIVVYKRITNNSELMPVNGKITSEGGYGTLDVSGFKNSRRDIAIHSVAVGDTIKVRFSGGDMFYNGHDEKGTRISVNGKTLERGDTIHSGDVLTVSQVDYLYNYVVLQFDARAVISGIFINTPEIEKILMPTITVKSNNTFVITAGKSTVGNEVVTCFTTDGTEPTLVNGTSGPYEQLEVQVLRGGEMTIKAISYSYDLKMSKVAEASFTAVDLTAQAATRGMTSSIDGRIMIDGEAFKDMQIFDMQGRRVSAIKPNMLYIINGKKVVFINK